MHMKILPVASCFLFPTGTCSWWELKGHGGDSKNLSWLSSQKRLFVDSCYSESHFEGKTPCEMIEFSLPSRGWHFICLYLQYWISSLKTWSQSKCFFKSFLSTSTGLGSGLAYTAAVVVISVYFNRFRPLALGLSLAGGNLRLWNCFTR